jgi:hypothetical protein
MPTSLRDPFESTRLLLNTKILTNSFIRIYSHGALDVLLANSLFYGDIVVATPGLLIPTAMPTALRDPYESTRLLLNTKILTNSFIRIYSHGALVGIQTPNLLIRSQMLYSVELRAQYLFRLTVFRRPFSSTSDMGAYCLLIFGLQM